MYTIKIRNGETEKVLHELDVNSVRRAEAFTFSRGINEKQKATITIYPQNPVYDEIYEKKTIIEIINSHTGEADFEGYVREIQDSGMNADGIIGKRIVCDGYLAILEETIQPYKSYSGTHAVSQFLVWLAYEHNKYTSDDKKITVGACNVAESGAFITEYNSTLQEIQKNLIDRYGGEIQIRRNSDGNLVLDYMTQIGTVKNTKVELARNMVSLNVSNDTSGLVTRLFPLGPKLNDNTGERMTIADVNNGIPYIDSAEGIAEYGIIQSTVDYSGDGDFDELAEAEKQLASLKKKLASAENSRDEATAKRDAATTASERERYAEKVTQLNTQISELESEISALETVIPTLKQTALQSIKTKSEAYLANNCRKRQSYKATVLDLSTIGEDADSFREGNTYTFTNRLIGLNEPLRVIRVTIDGYKPYSPTVEIGDKAATITSIATRAVKLMEYEMPKQKEEILESAKETASALIKSGFEGHVVTNEDEICIMDTTDKATATNVWRWNMGGLGYSSTGYDGLYGLAITMDGAIVADFITVGTIRGIRIYNGNGTFQVDPDGNVSASSVTITGGSFNINNVFTVDTAGNCVANSFTSNNATITGGSMTVSGSTGTITVGAGSIVFKNSSGNELMYFYSDGTFSVWNPEISNWAIGDFKTFLGGTGTVTFQNVNAGNVILRGEWNGQQRTISLFSNFLSLEERVSALENAVF